MLLISTCVFSQVTPPTNKSVNGIIEWVDTNFVASPSAGSFACIDMVNNTTPKQFQLELLGLS